MHSGHAVHIKGTRGGFYENEYSSLICLVKTTHLFYSFPLVEETHMICLIYSMKSSFN